ncbi:hypothetical protein UCDDS831_g07609 [Diplodia seriata]|uniref:Uncharacterized protein n=1 Tax=Diplodia seriata TaxID=420778 RepID=A0A0G2DZ47_9PEZI|nr:hypothetical protein UCDDS831_g07609 [Diplodia seriata]
MSSPSPDDDDAVNNNNNNGGQLAAAIGGGGAAPAIVANLLNTLLSSSASAELTRKLAKKMSALVKWSADTQVAAARLGVDAWEELAGVLVS